MIRQQILHLETLGRGSYEITHQVSGLLKDSGIKVGICQAFVRHTSASLVICENADPSVRSDLEDFLTRLVPDGHPGYQHSMEGPDDMPAHIRSILTNMDLSLPITEGRLGLGTWQGIFLYEHRTRPHRRQVMVTIIGD